MSLKRDFASGVVWSAIGNGANNIISFIVFAIIANVVSPKVLGIVSFAIVLVELGKLLNAAGIPELLIQRPKWDDDYAAVAFWVTIVLAVLMTVITCVGVAPLIDHSFAEGSGIALTALSACFLIDGIRVVQEAKLKREFKYRSLAARGSISGVVAGLLGVTMALMGYGIWALIAQRLLHSVLMTLLTWMASDWRPRFFWSTTELRPMLSNGGRLVGVGLLGTLGSRLPDLLLGAALGPAALAVYRVGSRGYDALVQLIVFPVGNATTAGFSRVAAAGNIGEAYVRATQFAALIGYPVFFGAAAIATQFVALAFGESWQEASYIMMALCLIAGPATLSQMIRPALISLNLTNELLRINIFAAITVGLACVAGLPFGAVGMAVALTIRAHLSVIFNLIIVRRQLNVDLRRLLFAVMPPYVAAMVMAVLVYLTAHLLTPDWHNLSKLALMILVGATVYPLVLWLVWRNYVHLAMNEVGEMFPPVKKVLRRFTQPHKAPL